MNNLCKKIKNAVMLKYESRFCLRFALLNTTFLAMQAEPSK